MSIAVVDIVSGAYTLLGRPSQGDLPYADLASHAADVLAGRLLDSQLATRNRTLAFTDWFTPTEQTQVFSEIADTDSMIPVRVEWRPVNSADTFNPYKVEVVAYDQLADIFAGFTEVAYVAIYDDYDTGETTIAFPEATSILAAREYRIAYEPLENLSLDISGTSTLKDAFLSLCKYETAVRALDQVENSTDTWADKRERLRGSLTAILQKEEQRFEMFNRARFGNKVVRKRGFMSRRLLY